MEPKKLVSDEEAIECKKYMTQHIFNEIEKLFLEN